MELITKKSELAENVRTLREYLQSPGIEREFALSLVQRGICFVVTQEAGNAFFAPSRFIGYRANSRHAHLHNEEKDGRVTNVAIAQVLRCPAVVGELLEQEYERFCSSIGVELRNAPFGNQRKFWDLR